MGNLVTPSDNLAVADSFNMYLTVATENSTSKNYDAKDIAGIRSAGEVLSAVI